jgi:hypothetical protein
MQSHSRQPQVEEIQGLVVAKKVLKGTASEHTGIVLETNAGENLRLQRVGGNPFADDITRRMVGHIVRLTGVRLGDIFRFTDYESTE